MKLRNGKEIEIPIFYTNHEKIKRRQRQGKTKGQRAMPNLKGKTHYLMKINATDCIKDKVTGCYLAEDVQSNTTPITPTITKENKKKPRKITPKKQKKEGSMTKTERKAKYNEHKRRLQQIWTTEFESEESKNEMASAPSHFKKNTIHERKIIVQQSMRTSQKPGESYDGPEDAKKINLAEKGEEPRPAYIATDLAPDEEELLIKTLKEYKDVFAWSYRDLKGVDPEICQHTIPLKEDAKSSRQRPYTYNDTFAKKIKEEIDKLLEAEFIYEIEHTDWVSPIVIVPKKNGKLRVCVNLKKVNAATIRDNYPLPIIDHVIE